VELITVVKTESEIITEEVLYGKREDTTEFDDTFMETMLYVL
jgi:hypothetical protein